MTLLKEIKEKLRPDKNILIKVDEIVNKVNLMLEQDKVKAICVTGGSLAKGTFIKDDYDADLFVRFDYEYQDKNISDILENVLKKKFKIERVHGSRDYFHIQINKLTFELVPVIMIKDYKNAINVTDMSPLHVDYMKKKLKKGQEDEIRLTKQFCKSAKVYGAESYIKGFSGHILDLLIINYGSFEALVKAAVDWKAKVIIDLEKHLKNPIKELDSAKTHSPLIIVDPVQPNRNAAAALNKEKFDKFISRCQQYLLHPSKEFFIVKKIDEKKIIKKVLPNEELFFFEANPLKGKKDVIGSKIMKVYEHLKRSIKQNEFEIIKTDWEFKDKGRIYFILKKETLPEKIIIIGPPITQKEGTKQFKEKHSITFEKNKRLYAEEKRKYRTASKLIKDLTKDEYVKERVAKIKLI